MKTNPKEISFYHLTALPITKGAPKLIEKIYYSKQNLVVIAENEALMKSVDDGLWVYSTKHFIPHGTCHDEHPGDQPVYLTTASEIPNNASIIMALGIVELGDVPVSKLIYMFDGNISKQLEFARKMWKLYQKDKHSLIYWKQNLDGTWEKQ